MSIISVKNLKKNFRLQKKEEGFMGSLKSLFHRKYIEKKAVNDITFDIAEGELIGFIGPNGAGKTTTLKCLSGLLYPSAGEVSVMGFQPFERKKEFLQKLSLVMGQKNQLWWDLPAVESFRLNKEIYQVSDAQYKKTLHYLSEILDIKDVLYTPVRNLSLGQRMKCELTAALIHSPKVLFLDEPTIGLDVMMQQNLREFIRQYNRENKATIILTSHYMEDVKELCERVIIIDNGTRIFDGKLNDIIREYATDKLITVSFTKPIEQKQLEHFGTIEKYEGMKATIAIPLEKTNHVAAQLLEKFPVDDLNIEEQKIENIIREVFENKK